MLGRLRSILCMAAFAVTVPAQSSPSSQTLDLRPEQLTFSYHENLEPWGSYPCKREKADVGLYEWDVYCKEGDVVHSYNVHLVVSYYSRTNFGIGAYEILYWVTDGTDPRKAVFDSSTVWIHNSHEDNRARVIQLSQGIENDQRSLSLTIDLTQ